MPEILINVINKIPRLSGDVRQMTADNTDYTIRFVFDDDWSAGAKTVYFVREGGFAYPAGRTENDTVSVPAVTGVRLQTQLYIGLQQGSVRTSRPCMIPVYAAITDMIDDSAVQPEPSLWEDIVSRVEELEQNGGGGGVSEDAVMEILDKYIAEHPTVDLYGNVIFTVAGTDYDDLALESVMYPPEMTDLNHQISMIAAGMMKVALMIWHSDTTQTWGLLDCVGVDWSLTGGSAMFAGTVAGSDGTKFISLETNFDDRWDVTQLVEHNGAEVDETLTVSGAAADAKVTGDRLGELSEAIEDKLDADKLPEAVNEALAQAKESGEFDGEPGDDYVLTDADKTEIAELAAGLIDTSLLSIIGTGEVTT